MRKDILYFLILLFIVAFFIVWFFGELKLFSDDSKKINVVTTSYYLFDFASEVGGENIDILNIVPIGENPYSFKLSPFDRINMRKADIILLSGGNLDLWANKIAKGLEKEGVLVLNMFDIFKQEGFLSENENNPFIWMDPSFAKKEVNKISEAFIKKDPKNESKYRQNAQKYIRRIDFLDKDYIREMEECLVDRVAVSNEAFYYLAKRYSFDVFYKDNIKNNMVLYDPIITPDIKTVFQDLFDNFLEVNFIANIKKEDKFKRKNYINLMRDNLNKIKKARKCKEV